MKEKKLLQQLKDFNILLVTHSRATGFSQMLQEWLEKKTNSLVYIDHSLISSGKTNSSMIVYFKGKIQKISKFPNISAPSMLVYLKDFFATIIFCLMTKKSCDLGIGVDNLNTFSLLFLRKIGYVKKVIYHTVDYTPNRFSNNFMNRIYHEIDKFCCSHADMIWNSSGRINEGRIKNGMDKNKIAKTIITPDGSNFDPKKRLSLSKIDRNQIVFLGHLRSGMGLKLLISSMPDILKQIPKIKLLIIGDGPLMTELEKMINEYELLNFVQLTGFIPNHKKVDDLLKKCAIGIALFEPTKDSIEYYSDVGKPKVYLSAGMPVIITKIPEIAYEINKSKAGIAIKYDKKEFVKAVILLLGKNPIYKEFRQNAIILSKRYIWGNIFKEAFIKSFIFLNI